jgi:hypothetical protein
VAQAVGLAMDPPIAALSLEKKWVPIFLTDTQMIGKMPEASPQWNAHRIPTLVLEAGNIVSNPSDVFPPS